jgi:Ca2+-binding RTX toxin-like protein
MIRGAAPVAAMVLLLGFPSPVEAAPPPNDNFAGRKVVASLPYEDIQNTAEATVEPGEPTSCTEETKHSVWYEFTPTADGVFAADTLGSDFDTVVAVYTGTSLADLHLVACHDDTLFSTEARVVFSAAGSTSYFIQVTGYFDDAGTLVFRMREVDAGVIAGTVTEEGTGLPLADICVGVLDADFDSVFGTLTDDQGRYDIPVRSGAYVVVFEDLCDRSNDHRSEWYDNKTRQADANRIEITAPNLIAGIDAALARTCPFAFQNRAQVIGTEGPDTLVGGPAAEVICGLGGADRITAGAGRDFVVGGAGRDRMTGGGDRDRMFGTAGIDRISGGGGDDGLHGSKGDDVLMGNGGDDNLEGGPDDDVLNGGAGRDVCDGDKGKDRAGRSCERVQDLP